MSRKVRKTGGPRPRAILNRRSQAFLEARILKHPGASAANATDRASSIHQMKSDTRGPSNSRLTLVKVGRRSMVRIARRLTLHRVSRILDAPVCLRELRRRRTSRTQSPLAHSRNLHRCCGLRPRVPAARSLSRGVHVMQNRHTLSTISKYRQNAFAMRICSGVRHSGSKSWGEQTRILKHFAREVATLSRFKL